MSEQQTPALDIQLSGKQWWAFAIVGLLCIAGGALFLAYPEQGYTFLAMAFPILVIAGGIFQVLFARGEQKEHHRWKWLFFLGAAEIAVGLILLISFRFTSYYLPTLLAIWALPRSLLLLVLAFDFRAEKELDWGNYFVLGLLSLILSIGLIVFPFIGRITTLLWASMTFGIIGIAHLVFALKLRRAFRASGAKASNTINS